MNDKTREMLEGALFQFQFMALMSLSGRADDADAAYAKGMERLSAVLAEPEPEPEPEHVGGPNAASKDSRNATRWTCTRARRPPTSSPGPAPGFFIASSPALWDNSRAAQSRAATQGVLI